MKNCVRVWYEITFHNQGHNSVGDAKRVAGHAAVSTMIHGLCIYNGNHRTIGANLDIVCGEGLQMTSAVYF